MISRFVHVLLTVLLLLGLAAVPSAAAEPYEGFMGEAPETFATPEAAVEAFRARLTAGDLDGMAKLLGLDAAEAGRTEDFKDRFDRLSVAAGERLAVEDRGSDEKVLILGRLVWPFPFPLVKDGDTWRFDTGAGLEEVVARRVGENELRAIETVRAYVLAQQTYAARDRDGDGVREYAQRLISSEGTRDGLYWPEDEWGEESPAGPAVVEVKLRDRKPGDGYFGYHFRILRGQGNQVAGDRYDYVINGNMIAGHALIAWPVEYGLTGVKTLMVSHHGAIYEKDLGPGTDKEVARIVRFNPDRSWSLVDD